MQINWDPNPNPNRVPRNVLLVAIIIILLALGGVAYSKPLKAQEPTKAERWACFKDATTRCSTVMYSYPKIVECLKASKTTSNLCKKGLAKVK